MLHIVQSKIEQNNMRGMRGTGPRLCSDLLVQGSLIRRVGLKSRGGLGKDSPLERVLATLQLLV